MLGMLPCHLNCHLSSTSSREICAQRVAGDLVPKARYRLIYTKDLILYFADSVDENMATLVQLQGPGDRQTLHDLLQQSLVDHLQVSVAMPLYEYL